MILDNNLICFITYPDHFDLKIIDNRLQSEAGEGFILLSDSDLHELGIIAKTDVIATKAMESIQKQLIHAPQKGICETLYSLCGCGDILDNLRSTLNTWCDYANRTSEHPSRLIASKRILECYLKSSDALDLRHLSLTTLPSSLRELLIVEVIHLEGNPHLEIRKKSLSA